jgi:hypothetical protein
VEHRHRRGVSGGAGVMINCGGLRAEGFGHLTNTAE